MPKVKIKTPEGHFKLVKINHIDNLQLKEGEQVVDVWMDDVLITPPKDINTTPKTPINFTLDNIAVPTQVTLNGMLHQVEMHQKKLNIPDKKDTFTKDSKLSDIYKYPPLSKIQSLKGKTPIKGGYTYIGVEIELEHIDIKRAIPNIWDVVDDHSLKVAGKEFVSVPIKAEWLEVEIERLLGCLSFWKSTSRCSTHVHLNARDLTLSELKVFLIIYNMFERLLYRISGDRWNNNFCVPLQFYQGYLSDVLNGLDKGVLAHNWKKYHGLNLSPLFGGESTCIGTIEFRHMKGFTSTPELLNWINTIISLKLACKKYTTETLINLLLEMNTSSSYIEFTREVFGDEAEQFITLASYKEDIESGVTSTKQLLITDNTECEIDIELV